MTAIGIESIADIFFQIQWQSSDARHVDAYSGRNINFWRDLFPHKLREKLLHKNPGDHITENFEAGETFHNGHKQHLLKLSRSQFDPGRLNLDNMSPRVGRFYPKGVLQNVAGIFRENQQPFRIVAKTDTHIIADMGHPLANKPFSVNLTVGSVTCKPNERGGALQDWLETITAGGVGMQAGLENERTDFFSDSPYERQDEGKDSVFYKNPRFVSHMDEAALDIVRQVYAKFIYDGAKVLDLMSSWETHLPKGVTPKEVIGIGMNEKELSSNRFLTEYRVHDLNETQSIPFAKESFDIVICSASIEYLTHPDVVFNEVARVLRPEGAFVVTFTNRWFPTKSVRIWEELHDFEKMGLALEHFRGTGHFSNLQTYSVRGLSRPKNDKYYGQYAFADPVYAVWGKKQ